jgi:hypothetical protein
MTGHATPTLPRPTWRAIFAALFGIRLPRAVIVLLVFVVVLGLALDGVSYLLAPWAQEFSGRPVLVGYWQGEMLVAPGDRRRVALRLEKIRTFREILIHGRGGQESGPAPNVRATATMCGAEGGRSRYRGSGHVLDRSGSRFTFALAPENSAPGRHPGEIDGAWNGADRLDLSTRLYTQRPDGVATAESSVAARPGRSDESGIVRFHLRRGTEQAFHAVC